MRKERELPIIDKPTSGSYIRGLDDSEPKKKSVMFPVSAIIAGGKKVKIKPEFDPYTYTEGGGQDIVYIASVDGTYEHFLDEDELPIVAMALDEIQYNFIYKHWDLIPVASNLEAYQRSLGARQVKINGVIENQYWTGTAWEATGTEIPY